MKDLIQEFESGFDQSWLPEKLLKNYSPIECLADNSGCITLLLQNKNDDSICVSKCYLKDEMQIAVAENEILSEVSHRGLPEYIATYENEETVCVLREYAAGKNLSEIIRERCFTSEEAADIILQICDILDYLHNLPLPVLHRDIKPENIIIDGNDVCLIDFGISRIVRDSEKKDTKIAATAQYAPPEQFGFLPTDARSDIYALGVVMNEMLTGSPDISNNVRDKSVKKIISKCTAFSPEDRFKSASQLSAAIKRWKNRYVLLAANIVMAITLIIAVIPATVNMINSAAENSFNRISESHGVFAIEDNNTDVYWSFAADSGRLIISGNGALSEDLLVISDEIDASYVTELIVNEGITGISKEAFGRFINLRKVTLPGSAVGAIDNDIFIAAGWLDEITVRADAVTGVGWSFNFESQVLTITYNGRGTGVVAGGDYWHHFECINFDFIRYVVVNEGIRELGFNVFWNHRKLESIELPETIEIIDNSNFADTPSLVNVFIHQDNKYFYSSDGVLYSTEEMYNRFHQTKTLYFVPRNMEGRFEIDSDTVIIGKFALADCTEITEVAFSGSLKEIGGSAFVNMSSLNNFEIYEESHFLFDADKCILYSVNERPDGDGVFTTMRLILALQSISGHYKVPETFSCVLINDGAFSGCRYLTEITIPINVRSMGDGAFINCTSLKRINMPENLDGIPKEYYGDTASGYFGYALFCGSGLESVRIPYGVDAIPDYCFSDCSYLTYVEVPETVEIIQERAFSGCGWLEYVECAAQDIEIHETSFESCPMLDKSSLPGS